jgi:NhaA family Na+:H+ antiporter
LIPVRTLLTRAVQDFLRLESAGGLLLLAAAVLACIVANSPYAAQYAAFLNARVGLELGSLSLLKPVLLWINDGLMAVFFFLVGLELKREVVQGELTEWSQISLPVIGALGGMAVPAAVYLLFNWDNPIERAGWPIPVATDIAFALAVLRLVGDRVPSSFKMFLLALAIFDDVGAIALIAVLFTRDLAVIPLMIAGIAVAVLFVLNRARVLRVSAYVITGCVLWLAVLKSGIHATLAGIILALFIPISPIDREGESLLHRVEDALHPWIVYLILPIFAFANAGLSLHSMSLDSILDPVPLGIAAGLFIGKPVGILAAVWLAVALGVAQPLGGSRGLAFFGVAILCGIGFTMSLFLGSLAFAGLPDHEMRVRLGVITGSMLSAVVGYLVLSLALPRERRRIRRSPRPAGPDR